MPSSLPIEELVKVMRRYEKGELSGEHVVAMFSTPENIRTIEDAEEEVSVASSMKRYGEEWSPPPGLRGVSKRLMASMLAAAHNRLPPRPRPSRSRKKKTVKKPEKAKIQIENSHGQVSQFRLSMLVKLIKTGKFSKQLLDPSPLTDFVKIMVDNTELNKLEESSMTQTLAEIITEFKKTQNK